MNSTTMLLPCLPHILISTNITEATTSTSDCSYIFMTIIILISHYPTFYPHPLTFAILPTHIYYLFDLERGSTGHGQFRTWVLTAKLADHTCKISNKLKLLLFSFSQWIVLHLFLGTYLVNFYVQLMWLKFRFCWFSCRHW